MPDLSEDVHKEIQTHSDFFQVSPEKYISELLANVPNDEDTREILLNDRERFTSFTREYMNLLDQIFHEELTVKKAVKNSSSRFQMDAAMEELIHVISANPTMLLRLYMAYKKAE